MKKISNLLKVCLVVFFLFMNVGCFFYEQKDIKKKEYKAGENGGLVGKSYLDDYQGKKEVVEFEIDKDKYSINEIVVIPKGCVELINFKDDSSWDKYCNDEAMYFLQGVFLKNRKLEISPYVISETLVTNKLYNAIMKNNAKDNNSFPKYQITWYEAVLFCNELTKVVFGNQYCVYYSDKELMNIYSKKDAEEKKTVFIAYDLTTKKITKKGYRLPTEVEWELAARGGDPNKIEWFYAYSGCNCTDKIYNKNYVSKGNPFYKKDNAYWTKGYLLVDPKSREYAVCYSYIDTDDEYIPSLYTVSIKKPNSLGIYDMSGELNEWCYDGYNSDYGFSPEVYDLMYKKSGWIVNPIGAESETYHFARGGCYKSYAFEICVSYRYFYSSTNITDYIGIRLVRSTEGEKILVE